MHITRRWLWSARRARLRQDLSLYRIIPRNTVTDALGRGLPLRRPGPATSRQAVAPEQ
jgi:hypothetical protein